VATDEGVAVEEVEQEGDRGQEVEMGDESDRPDMNEAVTPAVVDLTKVTPEAFTESETLHEMPQPGLPNPSAAASNRSAVELASALGLETDDVEIVSIEQVDWPDSSLGCPAPGESYATVITPGFRIVLEAGGQRYEYHADTEGRTVRCG
jgi:hypothetical protein